MKIIFFLLFLIIANCALCQNHKQIHIVGVVEDALTYKTVSATIDVIYSNMTLISSDNAIQTDANGSFKISLIAQNLTLKVTSEGYITSTINLNVESLAEPKIVCVIPLVREVSQQLNKLFVQSTTKAGRIIEDLKNTKNNKSTYVFHAIDGITRKNIPARFKVSYTQGNRVANYQTDRSKPSFKIDFVEKDIVAIEAMSDGYQTFFGSLTIDDLNNKIIQDTAKLIKNISFLNLMLINYNEKLDSLIFFEVGNEQTRIFLTKHEDIFFSLLNFKSKYQLRIKRLNQEMIIREFEAKEGINQLPINIKNDLNSSTFNKWSTNIYFEQGSYAIKEESIKTIDEIVKVMERLPQLKIEITGHTDNIGNYYQNLYLSEVRAMLIANLLHSSGINDDRITTKAFGGSKPLIKNGPEEKKGENRRVEVLVY